jgi:predicted nucleic acid-binding protein
VVIVDTTVWIDFFAGTVNPETEWLEREVTRQRLGVTDLILCEVLQGVRDAGEFAVVRDELLRLEVFEAGGAELAVQAAENYRQLRRKGFTVRKTIDCWIATFCLLSGNQLLHRDRDFYPFEKVLGLQVVKG